MRISHNPLSPPPLLMPRETDRAQGSSAASSRGSQTGLGANSRVSSSSSAAPQQGGIPNTKQDDQQDLFLPKEMRKKTSDLIGRMRRFKADLREYEKLLQKTKFSAKERRRGRNLHLLLGEASGSISYDLRVYQQSYIKYKKEIDKMSDIAINVGIINNTFWFEPIPEIPEELLEPRTTT